MIIAFEGLDGSGKTTQAKLLTEWLRAQGHKVSTTSPSVSLATKHAKKARRLTSRVHRLLAAADFWDRVENEVMPNIAAGEIIVADRWVHTAFARDRACALELDLVRRLYLGAPTPTICFYLRTSVETARARILADRHLKYHEAGMDLELTEDIGRSFEIFQTRVRDYYESSCVALPSQFPSWFLIDGELAIEDQQTSIRAAVEKVVEKVVKPMPRPSKRDAERDKLMLEAYAIARASKRGKHPRLARIQFGHMTEAELHELIEWHTGERPAELAA